MKHRTPTAVFAATSLAFIGLAWGQGSPLAQQSRTTSKAASGWQRVVPATPQFTYLGEYELAGSLIADLEPGDYDGDGHLDVAASSREGEITVLYGDGSGALPDKEDFWAVEELGDPGPWGIGASDFDGDGILDIAVSVGGAYDWVGHSVRKAHVYLGDDERRYHYASTVQTTSTFAIETAGADFNEDGHSDLVVAASDGIDMFLGNGDGTFGPAVPVQGSNPDNGRFAKAVDMNADGHMDLVVGHAGLSTGHRVFWGNGSGVLDSAQMVFLAPGMFFAIADFDGDHLLDTFSPVTTRFPNYTGSMWVTIQTPAQSFMQGPRVGLEFPNPTGVVAADFNGDGWADSIARNGNIPRFFLGQGSGGLLEVAPSMATLDGGAMRSGDWNADGKPDIAIVHELTGQTPHVRIYLNTTP